MRARFVDGVRGFAARALVLAAVWLSGSLAGAEDGPLVLMREPTPYTDVIDAAEPHDRFDLNAHLGYLRSVDRGTIEREYTEQGNRGREKVANSEQRRSQLMLGIEAGVWRDAMVFVRLPLVLSDERSLSLPGGQSADRVASLLTDPGDVATRDGTLFSVPLTSPVRAGFDYLAMGGALALTSQERRPLMPTWVLYVEGRRAVGALMQPCRDNREGANRCGVGAGENEQEEASSAGSGVSRGVSAFSLETRVSKRFLYAEPYAGLGAMIEWASTAKRSFRPAGALPDNVSTAPGRQVTATLGGELIPWEHKARFQRVAVDARLTGTYFTRGRDYSALYDAIGTSGHAGFSGESRGLTEVGSRIRYGGRLGVDIRAARYVRFAFGTALYAITAHTLTSTGACNTDAMSTSGGGYSCAPANPVQRPLIDLPGRRFWMVSELVFDLYASATAQF